MITVRDLIAELQKQPQDAVVILSSDSEGNSFSPLATDFGGEYYAPDSTYSGEWVSKEDKDGYDILHDCVVLFPIR